MTGALSIDLLIYAFTLITLLGIVAGTWQIVRGAPRRMRARVDREVGERHAAMTALADAHGRATDEAMRDALARNYRYHQASVRALDPGAIIPDLPLR